MEIELTIWQRAMLVTSINQVRGDVRTLRMGLRALEVLDFSEEERAAVGLVEEAGQMRWPVEAAEISYRLELEKPVARFLRNAAEGFEMWPVAQAGEVLHLLGKLGVEGQE